jgi:cytidine deaminase
MSSYNPNIVLGIESSETFGSPQALGGYLLEAMRAQWSGVGDFAVVKTCRGKLFFGLALEQAHPNCCGTALETAIGIAVTSGHHNIKAVGYYREGYGNGRQVFSGLELDRLSEHFGSDGRRIELFKMRLDNDGKDAFVNFDHGSLFGGYNRPDKGELPELPAMEKLPAELARHLLADAISENRLAEELVDALRKRLMQRIDHSTANGISKPGRKRHAACAVTLDGTLFYGVNLRADERSVDRCSEWVSLGNAAPAGVRTIAAEFIYSPDYGDKGKLAVCGKCRNSLGGFFDPTLGDMLVGHFENHRPNHLVLYTKMPNTSYHSAENGG